MRNDLGMQVLPPRVLDCSGLFWRAGRNLPAILDLEQDLRVHDGAAVQLHQRRMQGVPRALRHHVRPVCSLSYT